MTVMSYEFLHTPEKAQFSHEVTLNWNRGCKIIRSVGYSTFKTGTTVSLIAHRAV
jgi:hypothetical protein